MRPEAMTKAGAEQEGPESAQWYACYTRARHEKAVERHLAGRGYETYLPLVERERQWKDRKKLVEFPLFPSYVFVRFPLGDVHEILTAPGVATIVRVEGRPLPIADEELENVRRFVAALAATGAEPELRPMVEEGQRVRVTDGPFRGVEGVVVERRGRRRVLVGLTAIRQGMEVDVAVDTVEPVRG